MSADIGSNPSFFSSANFYALIITGIVFILGLLKTAFTVSDLKSQLEQQMKEQNEKIDSMKTDVTVIKTSIEGHVKRTGEMFDKIEQHTESVTDLEKKVMVINLKVEYSEQKIRDGLNYIYNYNRNKITTSNINKDDNNNNQNDKREQQQA
jgi:uncharacterized membrane-anchored protein YhcB (DUF1043 family)